MKSKYLPGLIFIFIFLGIIIAYFVINNITKSREMVILNSSNIVDRLNDNKQGQTYKIERDNYEIYSEFYVGHSNDSQSYDVTTYYDNYYFVIHIKSDDNAGYYMAVMIRTKEDEENDIVSSLRQGKTVDLTGMISQINMTYGTTKVIDEYHESLGNDKENILEYCLNIL